MKNYSELIADLSDRLNMEIYPDVNNVVNLMIEKRVKIQLESDPVDEFILLGAYVADLPPGKFREHILKNALKANHNVDKHPEILSYMSRENMLTLHIKLVTPTLTTDILIEHIKSIVERAKKWQDAIESGRPSPDDEVPDVSDGSKRSMFGL